MAEPARDGEDGPAPAAKPDPRAPGWADVRRALVVATRAVALAVAELARRPGSDAALEMARLCLGVQEDLGVIARRWEVDEAVIEAERARGFEEGAASCRALRARLELIDGG